MYILCNIYTSPLLTYTSSIILVQLQVNVLHCTTSVLEITVVSHSTKIINKKLQIYDFLKNILNKSFKSSFKRVRSHSMWTELWNYFDSHVLQYRLCLYRYFDNNKFAVSFNCPSAVYWEFLFRCMTTFK